MVLTIALFFVGFGLVGTNIRITNVICAWINMALFTIKPGKAWVFLSFRRPGIPNRPEIDRSNGKEGVLGHEEKYIVLDSLYKMEYERDEYNFKGIHDTSRSISILFYYAKGKSKDSIHYWYNLKDTALKLTLHQADSIFDAAKIRKDY